MFCRCLQATNGSKARFCLLEQILPRGPDYPFAKTMINHFKKVKGTLRSVETYQTLSKQEARFRHHGWETACGRTLWQLWSDTDFISSETRNELNSKEPFDEWEDLALFSSHYMVLVASNNNSTSRYFEKVAVLETQKSETHMHHNIGQIDTILPREVPIYNESSADNSMVSFQPRRFGASFMTEDIIYTIHGGYVNGGGEVGRTAGSFSITDSLAEMDNTSAPPDMIGPRMCHTITAIGNTKRHLLVGGRHSPNVALSDTWLRTEGKWTPADNLPHGLYRHAATSVNLSGLGAIVLLFGGRTENGKARNDWLYWHQSSGWSHVESSGADISPRFGSCIATINHAQNHGILLGGMDEAGNVLSEIYSWKLWFSSNKMHLTTSTLR